MVHDELGSDAQVLSQREVREPRFFGLRSRQIVEITATVSSPPSSKDDGVSDAFIDFLQESPYDVEIRPPLERNRFRTEMPPWEDETVPVPLDQWKRTTAEEINPTVLQRSLIVLFQQSLRFGGPLRIVPGRRRTVALVGPTGVGKTTTLVKIAAYYRRQTSCRVALLSLDAFRIAATEQLRQYASTIDVPMEFVPEPSRIRSTVEKMGPIDLLLVDTPGTSPKNGAKLRVIGDALDAAEVDETHLLLAATSCAGNLRETIRCFRPLGINGLTLTKLDEATGLGDLYPILKEDHFPLRFLSTGQGIPNDLEVAGPPRLACLAQTAETNP